LNLALITTDAAQARRFGRPDITGDVDRVLRLAQSMGFKSVVYLIVAGPQQDPFGSVNDLLFLAQRPALAGVSIFYPAPGSSDFHWCRQHGLLPLRSALMRATALPLAHVTDRLQAVTLLRLGRILNFMKRLLDLGQSIPMPDSPPGTISLSSTRMQIGKVLLAGFLKQGFIYGVDDRGQVYPHRTDPALIRAFLKGLENIRIRGTCVTG
jgi:hypothetical protein